MEVTIATPVAIGKYEVTFDEWQACLDDGGCSTRPDDHKWGRERRPVMNVTHAEGGGLYTVAGAQDRQGLSPSQRCGHGSTRPAPAPKPLSGGETRPG